MQINSLQLIAHFQIQLLIKLNFMNVLWKDLMNLFKDPLLALILLVVCFKYRLQSFKNEFCITNVLCHLLFCSRSPNSKSQCRLCSQLFVENASDFVSSIKYHFSLIFMSNEIFSKETELLFTQSRIMRFNLDALYSSQ